MIRCLLIRLSLVFGKVGWSGRPAWMRRHASSCADCRVQMARLDTLGDRLREGAVHLRRSPPPFTSQRVLANLPRAPMDIDRRVLPFSRVAIAALALALGLGGAFWGWRLYHVEEKPLAAPGLVAFLSQPIPDLPDGGQLLAFSERLDGPLEREWKLVVQDARAAAETLSAEWRLRPVNR
jgi:hypothetical protein